MSKRTPLRLSLWVLALVGSVHITETVIAAFQPLPVVYAQPRELKAAP